MKNIFGEHQLDLENKLLTQIWKNESLEMTEADFKEIMIEYRDLILEHKPNKILIDSLHMNYTLVPEMQNWINTEVGSKVLEYNEKIAFVMPSDFFEQVSIQQSMDDVKKIGKHSTEYFDNIEEAKSWVLS